MCLSKPVPNKRHSMLALGSAPVVNIKNFEDLRHEHGYREFFKLQQSFQWNITMHLVGCLERLLGRESNGQNDLLVIQALDLIHGILILHPPSRELFAREIYMNVRKQNTAQMPQANNLQLFLDLLDPQNCPAIQSSTILALVTSLLDTPQNTRTFESIDGLLVVTSLWKAKTTTRDIKQKLIEFLYFYLMPESRVPASASATNTAVLGGRGKELAAAFDVQKRRETVSGHNGGDAGDESKRTPAEKQELLGRYFGDARDLVRGVDDAGKLFGGGVSM